MDFIAGTECLRCTALQQQGDVPISQNPRKYVSVDTGEKFKRNEKPPKLHRGWHPGQRTPSPYHREVSTTKDRKTLEEPIWMPRNEQRASNTRREYLFDAEDGDAYVSDHDDYEEGVDESSSDDDEVEDFVPRGVDFREDSTQGSETDLNCRHFSRYLSTCLKSSLQNIISLTGFSITIFHLFQTFRPCYFKSCLSIQFHKASRRR